MKNYHSLYFLLPLLGITSACAPPRPCCDEVVSESYIHRYGVPLPQEEWAERGRHGQVLSTQKDGVVACRNYEGGVLHGECTYTFPHRDRIQKKEIYNCGNLTQQTVFYSSGVPQQQTSYVSPEQSSVYGWHENGAPQFSEDYENGLLTRGEYFNEGNHAESQVNQGTGLRTRRDGLGQLQSVDTIENGQMVLRTTYHPNGAPATLTPYVNGVIQGQRRTYQASGEPATLETWSNNSQHGMTTLYENGDKLAEVTYVNGRKHGIERRYKDGEVLAQESTWVADQKQGPCYTYIGNTTQTDWYFGDKIVNKATYDVLRSQ